MVTNIAVLLRFVPVKKNGGKEYSITKWFDNRTSRFIEFDLGRFSKAVDPLDEDEAAEAAGIKSPQSLDFSGFFT